jgi:hypothetical protein
MSIRKIGIRHFLFFLAIENRQSKFGNSDIRREHAKAFGVPAGA